MALITRIGRLFSADFNAVLDRIEEPDVLLKQALREMEEDLHRDAQQLKLYEKEYSLLAVKMDELSKSIEQVDQELDICFESGETKLARSQVKKKLEIQRYHKHCISKSESLLRKTSELKTRIDENKMRFSVMQQKLELLSETEAELNGEELYSNITMTVKDDDIEMAFLREKQARGVS
ncbi:MAG: PspA/IM30 family protein [Gammaproteobacteria bacterium]|nr:PspA/IM30 family protein [Gammaproteobacteria bacterium]MCW8986087.1 PspA/IM30 family protein [Gammaproteobacteria bacterium]MCW9030727.1 PspA/IM30 family protein [Gammaproteobacteria bacterium]